jgi:hypothetical protein
MIKRSLSFALCLSAFMVILAAPCWAASLNDVIRALETPFQNETDQELRIYDYSADFFQESKIASLVSLAVRSAHNPGDRFQRQKPLGLPAGEQPGDPVRNRYGQ